MVSKLNFNNLKAPKKIRDSYLGPFTIIKLVVKDEVDVEVAEKFSIKHPVLLFSFIKPYNQTYEGKIPRRKEGSSPGKVVEEDSPGEVKRILKYR
ncbi:hypothetical protein O181_010305 [Austropuccinia psidii MF-1]|uniref:Uncharacterized protein n=1 Tax=Austropuccinia psidii MF-1 TaxID=1389203 RepID=A0A9Q3GKR8_9BASI|nr:hypothetical protein [Austropuccinia psidii MF-1]